MIIRLFDIEGGQLIPSIHCFTLKELQYLMEVHPDNYLKMYQYIFYMTCLNPDLNPFFNVPESEKEEMILTQLGNSFSPEDDGVVEALNLARKLYETPTARAYYGIQAFIENMASIMSTKITFGRDSNADSLLKMAERYGNVRESYKGTYKDLMEEQETKARGGTGLAYDDQG